MKSLWAPWRMEFIEGTRPQPEGCIFCELSREKKSVKNLICHHGKKAFVILNRYPYSNGHLMVIPYRHVGNFEEITPAEHQEIGALISRSLKALKKALNAQGFNVGLNLGKAAGAGIESHVHYHVVPRWIGDVNFMPVVGEVRVLPEFIELTYKKLAKCF